MSAVDSLELEAMLPSYASMLETCPAILLIQ